MSTSNYQGSENFEYARQAPDEAEYSGSSIPDNLLWQEVRSKSEKALSLLYDRYSSLVYAVAFQVLRSRPCAEEVVQDVFLRLWREPASFDPTHGELPAWLTVVARHRAIDLLRQRRPEGEPLDLRTITDNTCAPPDQCLIVKMLSQKVRSALETMPPKQRVALLLALFEGLSHQEISTLTGESLGSTKSRIRSGFAALRKIVGAP